MGVMLNFKETRVLENVSYMRKWNYPVDPTRERADEALEGPALVVEVQVGV